MEETAACAVASCLAMALVADDAKLLSIGDLGTDRGSASMPL